MFFTIFPFMLCPLFLSGSEPEKKTETLNAVTDKMISYLPSAVKIEGYLGEKINLVIEGGSGYHRLLM